MAHEVKVRQAGGSVAVTIPKEIADELRLRPGDTVTLSSMADGVMITPRDDRFERTWKLYEDISRKYRNTLRELAK